MRPDPVRFDPAARALKNSVLQGAAGRRPADALARGVEAAGQVGASASEFLRVRRDPAEVAVRRRRAAVRRVNIWGAGVVVGGAAGIAVAVDVVHSGLDASVVFSLVLVVALFLWCVLGLVRSVTELRSRSRVVAALPAPQPARRPVAAPIRGEMARLDSYSDGLRQLLSMLSRQSGAAELRRDVTGAADGAERSLRRQAQDYTGLHKALAGAPQAARPGLQRTADDLAGRISGGVDEFGRLVTAATGAVSASAALEVAPTGLQEPTDRLQALAIGMREIVEHVRPGGPAV